MPKLRQPLRRLSRMRQLLFALNATAASAWMGILLPPCELRGADPPPLSEARSSVYSLSTVVVYNTNVPESRDLAFFYAKARGIPPGNVVALTCPNRENVSRTEYNETVAGPLRDAFIGNGWWKMSLDPEQGVQVIASRVSIVALIYGMPLRIDNNLPAPAPKTDPGTGNPLPAPPITPLDTNMASLDSELSVLAWESLELKGPGRNPYFEKAVNFYQARIPGLLLVGRLDAPRPELVRNMILDAIEAEKNGLWGFACIDLSQKYEEGDKWLREAANALDREGIPVILETNRATFPLNYPMRNVSLYFGWYDAQVSGPFLNPRFRFRPGAIASHLHSFSAQTLRSTDKNWAGPLLDRGAAAVLGNVHEPLLMFTHHYDIFCQRLLEGFTFIESAYMSVPSISWMAVAVGDPLYRPFESFNHFEQDFYDKDDNAAFKALRLAAKRWGREDPIMMRTKLELAADKLDGGVIFEGVALNAALATNFSKAESFLEKAFQAYEKPEDRLRIRLHQAEMARVQARREDAIAILTRAISEASSLPEAEAPQAILNELRPPPPPMPPPPPAG